MPVGTLLNAAHFVAGQKVDVAGITRGHGFAGGMKRRAQPQSRRSPMPP